MFFPMLVVVRMTQLAVAFLDFSEFAERQPLGGTGCGSPRRSHHFWTRKKMADLGYFGWVSIHANFAILKGQLEAKSLGKVGKVIYIPPPRRLI